MSSVKAPIMASTEIATLEPVGNKPSSDAMTAHAPAVLPCTLLTGKRLVSILDTMDHHHELLKQTFTTGHDPFQILAEDFAVMCMQLRATISPEVEKLFVMSQQNQTKFHYDYQTRRRVWDSIYKRIEAPVGNPYRFTHISSHRHVRLDDHVRSLLSEDVQKTLPTNMDPRDYNLPGKLRGGAPNRSPRRSTAAPIGQVIPGSYANDDIIHSPTAQVATRPRSPVSEVYHTKPQGELRRPTKLSNSPRRTQNKQSRNEPQTPTKNSPQIKTPKKTKTKTELPKTPENKRTALQAEHVEENGPSNIDDSDCDDCADGGCLHREHCRLCHHYKHLNMMVAGARINAHGATGSPNAKNTALLAARRVKDFQYTLRLMEKFATTSDSTYDPADTRLWPQLAEHLSELLESVAQEERLAMNNLLANFRRTTFVPVDRDNVYDEDDRISCPLRKELPLSSNQTQVSGPKPDPGQVVIDKLTPEQRDIYEHWWNEHLPYFDDSDDESDFFWDSDENENESNESTGSDEDDDTLNEELNLELFNNY